MKIQATILLFFIASCTVFGLNTPKNTHINTRNDVTIVPYTATSTDNVETGGAIGISSTPQIINPDVKRNNINSILSFSILIFLTMLVIILIDNRNLQRKYKKLASDYQKK